MKEYLCCVPCVSTHMTNVNARKTESTVIPNRFNQSLPLPSLYTHEREYPSIREIQEEVKAHRSKDHPKTKLQDLLHGELSKDPEVDRLGRKISEQREKLRLKKIPKSHFLPLYNLNHKIHNHRSNRQSKQCFDKRRNVNTENIEVEH